jgi:putative tricarboxylic transport membrane protein
MEEKNLIPHAVLFLVGVAYVVESFRLGIGSPHSPGSGFVPFFTAAVLVLLSLISIIRKSKATKGAPAEGQTGMHMRSVLLVVFGLFGYVVSLRWLGYLISTFLMLLFLFRAGGIRRPWFVLAAAVLTTATSFFIFDWCLSLRFPRGVLGF